MRILVTGASSPLAVGVLRRLLLNSDVEMWCGRHQKDIPIDDPRLHVIDLDLESDLSGTLSRMPFDKVIHFAGVTHAFDEQQYWKVNLEGTVRLAEATRENGCGRFVYISTRCATHGSGEYGESKLAAEQELQKLEWKSLLIIRPAEIYGGGGNEGIDRMLALARRWRIIPALFGHSNLLFAPMHVDDFTKVAAELIQQHDDGIKVETVCGPEDLTGLVLAYRISKRFHAVPLPLWWPAVAVSSEGLAETRFCNRQTGSVAALSQREDGNCRECPDEFQSIKAFSYELNPTTASGTHLAESLSHVQRVFQTNARVRIYECSCSKRSALQKCDNCIHPLEEQIALPNRQRAGAYF